VEDLFTSAEFTYKRESAYPFPGAVPFQVEFQSALGSLQILEVARKAMLFTVLLARDNWRRFRAVFLTSIRIVRHPEKG